MSGQRKTGSEVYMTRKYMVILLAGLCLWLTACGDSSNDTLSLNQAASATQLPASSTVGTSQTGQVAPTPGSSRVVATRPPNRPAEKVAVNFSAPEFTLKDLQGQPVKLSDFQGQPVIINFWATWCGPCKQELPLLNKTFDANKDKLVVLGVDVGEDSPLVKLKVREVGLTYFNVIDSDKQISLKYRVDALPTSYFLDKDGVIRDSQIGALDADSLPKKITKITG